MNYKRQEQFALERHEHCHRCANYNLAATIVLGLSGVVAVLLDFYAASVVLSTSGLVTLYASRCWSNASLRYLRLVKQLRTHCLNRSTRRALRTRPSP